MRDLPNWWALLCIFSAAAAGPLIAAATLFDHDGLFWAAVPFFALLFVVGPGGEDA